MPKSRRTNAPGAEILRNVDQHCPSFATFVPMSSDVDESLARFCQHSPMLVIVWQSLTNTWQTSAQHRQLHRPSLGELVQMPVNFPSVPKSWPDLAEFGQRFAQFGQVWSNLFGACWAIAELPGIVGGSFRQHIICFCPGTPPSQPKFGRSLLHRGRTRPKHNRVVNPGLIQGRPEVDPGLIRGRSGACNARCHRVK